MRRVGYRAIGGPDGLLARQVPFAGNSMSACVERDGYVVRSYATAIAEVHRGEVAYPRGPFWRCSTTTSRHVGLVRAWLDTRSYEELRDLEAMAA